MHATGFNSLSLLGLIDAFQQMLAARGPTAPVCEIVLADARGHGMSHQAGWDGYDWELPARDMQTLASAFANKNQIIPAIGFGHSMGGSQIILAQQIHGRSTNRSHDSKPLFDGMVIAEPIIPPTPAGPPEGWVRSPLAQGALRRRSIFPSRSAACQRLGNKPPLSLWDPLSREGYLAAGLVETNADSESRCDQACDSGDTNALIEGWHELPWDTVTGRQTVGVRDALRRVIGRICGGNSEPESESESRSESSDLEVRLACSPELESQVFGGWHTGYRHLGSTPVGRAGAWIVAGEDTTILDIFANNATGDSAPSILPGPGVFQHLADCLPNQHRVKFVKVPRAGHLVPQEAPEATARVLLEAVDASIELHSHGRQRGL